MIWFTSDPHYGHKNIVEGISNWDDKSGCRKFDTLEEMNDTIVNNINAVVQEDDTLYVLGDWSFGGIANIMLFRSLIICKNVHIIYGNHDEKLQALVKPLLDTLFTSYGSYAEIRYKKRLICMSHYPMRVWNESHKGSWMLHGHCHGTLPSYQNEETHEFYRTMDVGMDTHTEFRPYSIEEIEDIFEGCPVLLVDHHNEKTN